MKKLLLITLLVAGLTVQSAQAQELDVETIRFGMDVQERELVGEDSVFASTVGTVYAYTHITGAQDTTQVHHAWYYQDEEKARVSLNVRSSNWRTWSSKRILPSWTGTWRVMVEDADGNVLATGEFEVRDEETE